MKFQLWLLIRKEKIIYPENKGFKVNIATTTNFSEPENFVVLECVNRLLHKGYRPENIELERAWTLGHEQKVESRYLRI